MQPRKFHDPDGKKAAVPDRVTDYLEAADNNQKRPGPLQRLVYHYGELVFILSVLVLFILGLLIYFLPYSEGAIFVLTLLAIISLFLFSWMIFEMATKKVAYSLPGVFAVAYFILIFKAVKPGEFASEMAKAVKNYMEAKYPDKGSPSSDSLLVKRIDSIAYHEIDSMVNHSGQGTGRDHLHLSGNQIPGTSVSPRLKHQ